LRSSRPLPSSSTCSSELSTSDSTSWLRDTIPRLLRSEAGGGESEGELGVEFGGEGDLAGDLAGDSAGDLAGEAAGDLAGDLAGNLADDLAGNFADFAVDAAGGGVPFTVDFEGALAFFVAGGGVRLPFTVAFAGALAFFVAGGGVPFTVEFEVPLAFFVAGGLPFAVPFALFDVGFLARWSFCVPFPSPPFAKRSPREVLLLPLAPPLDFGAMLKEDCVWCAPWCRPLFCAEWKVVFFAVTPFLPTSTIDGQGRS
jgi:hypothetical protein